MARTFLMTRAAAGGGSSDSSASTTSAGTVCAGSPALTYMWGSKAVDIIGKAFPAGAVRQQWAGSI